MFGLSFHASASGLTMVTESCANAEPASAIKATGIRNFFMQSSLVEILQKIARMSNVRVRVPGSQRNDDLTASFGFADKRSREMTGCPVHDQRRDSRGGNFIRSPHRQGRATSAAQKGRASRRSCG